MGGKPFDDADDSTASAMQSRHPWTRVKTFSNRIRETFGWPMMAFIISSDFFIKGIGKHLIMTTFLPYAQTYLKFSAQAFQRFDVLVSFPWMLKPFCGLVTDTLPIGGYRKRYYLSIFATLGTVCLTLLAQGEFGPWNSRYFTCLVLGVNTWVAFSDTLTGARVFEAMSGAQRSGSDLMTWQWSVATAGSLIGTLLSYFGLASGRYNLIYWMAMPTALQFVFTTASGLLPEDPANFNAHALAKKHWDMFTVTMVVTVISVVVIIMQLIDEIERNLYLCFGCCLGMLLLLMGTLYWKLEKRTALMLMYLLIERFLCVNVKQAKVYWYTEDKQCVPDGPHFDYVFFSVITFAVALVAQFIGIYLFQEYLSRSKVRYVFIASTVTKIIAKSMDIWIIMRLNLRMGIDDRSAYVFGEGVIEGVAYIFTFMPSAAVLSKVCEKNVETTLYTLLGGIVNVGQALAVTMGSASMTFVGIHTDLVTGNCNFDRLIPLLVTSGMVIPLLSIPFIFLFIPDWTMDEDLSGSIDESVKNSSSRRGSPSAMARSPSPPPSASRSPKTPRTPRSPASPRDEADADKKTRRTLADE